MIGHGVSSRSSHSAAAGRTTSAANSCTQSLTWMTSSDSSRENDTVIRPFRDSVNNRTLTLCGYVTMVTDQRCSRAPARELACAFALASRKRTLTFANRADMFDSRGISTSLIPRDEPHDGSCGMRTVKATIGWLVLGIIVVIAGVLVAWPAHADPDTD